MNPDSDQISGDSRDDLIDALLAEHARLGTASDEGLLATIRARTTEMPAAMEPVTISEARFGVKDWMKVAATVTVALGLLWLVLQTGSEGPMVASPRTEDTLRLVVIPHSTETSSVPDSREPRLPVTRTPDFATLMSGNPDPNARERFPGRKPYEGYDLADLSLSGKFLSEFTVSAEKILHGDDNQRLVYEGDVVLTHPDFTIKADRLEVAANVSGGEKLVGGFVASGVEIEVDRLSASGSFDRAKALQVTYAAEDGALILEGAPSLSSGFSYVSPKSSSGVIVLLRDGYQVIEPAVENR